jgi:lysyl-tRNA synthetase class 2
MKRAFWSPSELAANRSLAGPVLVGGRIVELGGDDGRCRLADAVSSLEVTLSAAVASTLEIGWYALVQVEPVPAGAGLHLGSAELRQAWAAPAPSGSSEFGKLAYGGRGAALLARQALLTLVRALFESAGFIEVDTPQRVLCPGSDAYVEPFRTEAAFLITSPEHHMKRLVAGGLHQIFQLCHCFRRDEAGALHQSEFMMLEWYRAFSGAEALMADTEQLVAAVLGAFLSGAPERAISLARNGAPPSSWCPSPPSLPLLSEGRYIDLQLPFERLTVADAFARYADVPDAVELAERDEDEYFRVFVESVEPALEALDRPVFLHGFPACQAALAELDPNQPRRAQRFELYVAGVELCNGYAELRSAEELGLRQAQARAHRAERGLPELPADRALAAALQGGFPPCAGNALGVDRLLALALGHRDIRQVVSFTDAEL